MPDHVFKPERTPPTWVDRLLVHPLDTTVAGMAILFSFLTLSSIFVFDFMPSKSMETMPWFIIFAVSAFLGTGGLLAMVGLYWRGDTVSRGWVIERIGWMLAGGGFLSYSLTVLYNYPNSIFSWTFPLGLGLGSALRYWSVVRIERSTRRTIEEVKGRVNE